MKKTYQTPEAEIVRFETETVLAGEVLSLNAIPGSNDPAKAAEYSLRTGRP